MNRKALFIAAFLLGLSAALPSLAQPAPTQCTTTAVAGGTANAISLPSIPCWPSTTLLLLTFTAANTSSTVTISVNGGPPYAILNFDGSALIPAIFQPNQVRLLTFNGANWKVISQGIYASCTPGACANASVANTAALAASSTLTFPNGVWRLTDGVANSQPEFYDPVGAPCAAPDGATCINSANSQSWVSRANEMDAQQFGVASLTNATQVQTALNWAYTNGYNLVFPPLSGATSATTVLTLPQGFVQPQNFVSCVDTVNAGAISGNPVDVGCFEISRVLSGPSQVGSRTTLGLNTSITNSLGDIAGNNFIVGLENTLTLSANQGGTSLVPKGEFFTYGGQLTVTGASTFLDSVFGQELDISMQSGSSTSSKIGLYMLLYNSDAVQGTNADEAIGIDTVTANTWRCGLCFGGNGWPISPTGTLVGSFGNAGTAGSVINLANLTFSNAAINFAANDVFSNGFMLFGKAGIGFNGILTTWDTNTDFTVNKGGGTGTMLTLMGPHGGTIANQIDITSAVTLNSPTIQAAGSDSNVGLILNGKNGFGVQIGSIGNGLLVGNPSGGYEGPGTINAQNGFLINGVPGITGSSCTSFVDGICTHS